MLIFGKYKQTGKVHKRSKREHKEKSRPYDIVERLGNEVLDEGDLRYYPGDVGSIHCGLFQRIKKMILRTALTKCQKKGSKKNLLVLPPGTDGESRRLSGYIYIHGALLFREQFICEHAWVPE